MNGVMRLIGLLAFIAGMVFVGQGTGYFPYPSSSFMVNQPQWALIGGVLMAGGLALHWMFRAKQNGP